MFVPFVTENFAPSLLGGFFTYALFSFPLFAAFWLIWKRHFRRIRIQETASANGHHFRHDLLYSGLTILLYAVIDVVLLFLHEQGFTQIYPDIADYGWGWLVASFVIMVLLNDAFFYWAHRAMHHPRWYPFFHRVHHESTDPSPLTSFAFHPSEAIVEGFVGFVLPFVMPLHFSVIVASQVFDMLNNVLAHLGYELYPQGWTRWPVLKFKTASTHHNMHHERFDGNYGLYFTWWDKWMGTEFADYESQHQRIFERGKAQPQPSVHEPIAPPLPDHTTAVQASLPGETYAFRVETGQNILQAALDQGVPLPHACRRGRCGTCKMQCVSGEAEMPEAPALSAAEREAGYLLTCQARAQGGELRLEKK